LLVGVGRRIRQWRHILRIAVSVKSTIVILK
jgi:hypothetical protein